jgi:indole-3-glycerol phosphate synthase
VTGSRRLSQAISEGDGISLLVPVSDVGSARAAEEHGAEGIVLYEPLAGVREATRLPILWRSQGSVEDAHSAGADALLLVFEQVGEEGRLEDLHAEAERLALECVVEVRDEEELELALERIDPEIFLLSSVGREEGEAALERVLDLLPDVPAGKLAIAEVPLGSRDEVLALERAGIDAVIVAAGSVAELVGGSPPEV